VIKIIDPVIIEVFSLTIRWYGVIIVSGIIISLIILKYLLKNEEEFDFEFFLDFIILALPLGIIAARLYYVLFNLDYYLNEPLKILAINQGGLAIHGGLLMGTAVLFFLTKKRDKKFLKALDYLAPITAFAQSLGRWGNFVNQEAYGQIVSESYYNIFPEFIKNQMWIDGAYREATFLYESVLNFILFIILLFYLKSKNNNDGEIFSLYLIFYSIFRFFIEEQRTDSLLIAGQIQVAKLISVLMIIIGSALLYYIKKISNSKK